MHFRLFHVCCLYLKHSDSLFSTPGLSFHSNTATYIAHIVIFRYKSTGHNFSNTWGILRIFELPKHQFVLATSFIEPFESSYSSCRGHLNYRKSILYLRSSCLWACWSQSNTDLPGIILLFLSYLKKAAPSVALRIAQRLFPWEVSSKLVILSIIANLNLRISHTESVLILKNPLISTLLSAGNETCTINIMSCHVQKAERHSNEQRLRETSWIELA